MQPTKKLAADHGLKSKMRQIKKKKKCGEQE